MGVRTLSTLTIRRVYSPIRTLPPGRRVSGKDIELPARYSLSVRICAPSLAMALKLLRLNWGILGSRIPPTNIT